MAKLTVAEKNAIADLSPAHWRRILRTLNVTLPSETTRKEGIKELEAGEETELFRILGRALIQLVRDHRDSESSQATQLVNRLARDYRLRNG